jgi:hypothetical protein
MALTPGIEPGPTGWQFKTIPRRHSNIHLKRPELQLFIIQTDFTSSNKEEKFVTSANKEESYAHNINYIVLIIILGTAWFRRNMVHSGKILCTYLPIQKYHIVPHLT